MNASSSISSLASSIASWRDGSTGFFQFLDDVQPRVRSSTGGFTPYLPGPGERAEIARALDDGDVSVAVFCWPRRHGKSVTSAMIILWRFLTRQTEQVAVVANSEKQVVDTAFRTLREAFEQTPLLKRLAAAGTVNVLGERIDLPSAGSSIQAFSANPAALWGKKLSTAQVSELHAAPRGDEVFAALAGSLLDTAGSLMLIDSTVSAKSSKLYELYQAATHSDDPDRSIAFSHLSYTDLDDACRNAPAWISAAKLRSLSRQMLSHEFALYHLNRWQDAANTLFPADMLAACVDDYPIDVKAIATGSAFIVGAGLDRAFGGSRHGDRTVTACVAKVAIDDDEHLFVLDADSVFLGRLGGIKSRLDDYHSRFAITRATLESYGAQDVADYAATRPYAAGVEVIHRRRPRAAASPRRVRRSCPPPLKEPTVSDETPAPDSADEIAALKAQLSSAEATLTATAAAVLAGVPEHLKALVPTSLLPADQIAWFNAGKASGVFDRPAVATTDGGVKPTITPVTPDPASLPAFARIAAGYRKN